MQSVISSHWLLPPRLRQVLPAQLQRRGGLGPHANDTCSELAPSC